MSYQKLKRMIKNKRAPISSLVKNYLISEVSVFAGGLTLDRLKKMNVFLKKLDPSISSRLSSGLNGLRALYYNESTKKVSWHPSADVDRIEDDGRNDSIKVIPNKKFLQFLQKEDD